MEKKFIWLTTFDSIKYHVFHGDRCVVSGSYDPHKKVDCLMFDAIRDAYADEGYLMRHIEV